MANYAIERGTQDWDIPLNAALTDIDSRLDNIAFNVKSYGALGNGSFNDAPAIQAAVDAAALVNGGLVYFPPGTYNLGQTINVPAIQGLTLQGSGWSSSLKVGNQANVYAITFSGMDTRITIRDLRIDGNYLEQTTASGGIYAAGAVACLFDNIHFTFCRDESLFLGGLNDLTFGHNNRVVGCLFDQTEGSAGPGRGIHTTSSDENQIIACDFEFLGGAGANAASIYDESGTNFIDSCNFVNGGNDAKGIRVQNAKSTKITNCNFDGLAGDNVFIAGQRCVVANNTFFSPGIAGTAGQASAIYLEFANAENSVIGNVIASAPGAGVSYAGIRESADGGGGNNNIAHNIIVTDGAWSLGAFDLSGANSTVFANTGSASVLDSNLRASLSLSNDATPPTGAPAGVAMYSEGGVLKIRQNNQQVIDTSLISGLDWQPKDHGLIGWTVDPGVCTGNATSVSGTIYFIKIPVRQAATITNLILSVGAAGVTLTAGQNLVGLYDAAGNKLGESADQSVAFTTVGTKTIPLITPVAVQPGFYYVAMMSNGTTPANFIRAGAASSSANNFGGTLRSVNTVGNTSLPATFTPGSANADSNIRWAAIN